MGLFGNREPAEIAEFKTLMWPVLTAHKEVGLKQSAFLKDPFVDGFLFGAFLSFRDAPACANLSPTRKARIIIAVDEMITPPWPGIFWLLQLVVARHPRNRYLNERNPDWMRGSESGGKFVSWIYGLGDIAHDPDVQHAIEFARALVAGAYFSKTKDTQLLGEQQPNHQEVTDALFLELFEQVINDRFPRPKS